MKFYLFKHTVDNSVFGATDEPSGEKLPVLPGNGRWKSFTDFEESGKPRIAFQNRKPKRILSCKGTISPALKFVSTGHLPDLKNESRSC